jgi:predicted transcriptional regulator
MEIKAKRLEMRMENSFLNKIQELADSQKISKAELMRQAIGLYAQALEEASHGRVIKFEEVIAEGRRELTTAH